MQLVSVLCLPVSSIPTSLSFFKSFCPCYIVYDHNNPLYSRSYRYCNSFSSYFPAKSHFLPYNLCIVYHVEIHRNSSGYVAISITATVYTHTCMYVFLLLVLMCSLLIIPVVVSAVVVVDVSVDGGGGSTIIM